MTDDLILLRLQLEWGADEALGDVAMDRFAPALRVAAPAPARPPGLDREVAVRTVPAAASFDAWVAEFAAFEGCALSTTAMRFVKPDGNPQARLMIIGDAPGSDDDRSGQAYSGASGQLIDRVLGSIGVNRGSALLATLVPWRPPGNRRPSETEIQSCLPFVHRLLGLVRPRHLVLLGTQTVRVLTGDNTPLRRLRGKWLEVTVQNEQLTIVSLALPTPDQWLISAAAKQQLWSDMVTLQIAVTTA